MVGIDADVVLVTVVTDAVLFVQQASKCFCYKRSGFLSQPSGSLPALNCYLLAGISLLGQRDKSRIEDFTTTGLKSSSITLALRSRSLKKVTVLASGMLFITASPTHSSRERLSNTWNSSSSS
jgi:hypothetical protein